MTGPVVGRDELDALRALDTPTICNALEVVAPERRGSGYTIHPLVCAWPDLEPIVGYARTATVRAAHPSGRAATDDLALRLQVRVRLGVSRPDAPPGAAGQLPSGVGRAVDDGRYLVERDTEHVVQHEREPLGGGERLEHHQQREADRVGQERFVLGVGLVREAHDRVGHARAQGVPQATPRVLSGASAACSSTPLPRPSSGTRPGSRRYRRQSIRA